MPHTPRLKSQQFGRRRQTVFEKFDELVNLCDAYAALLIYKNGRYYTYRSTDKEPPSWEEIVCSTRIIGGDINIFSK
jgi:beta-xylosidase